MALAPARLKKTWAGSLGKHATFVAILSAPAADTNRWHSRATRSSAMDGGSWMLCDKGSPDAAPTQRAGGRKREAAQVKIEDP